MTAEISPQAIAEARKALGVPPGRLPRSVAIIMDGNGRWARARNLPRGAGHQKGAETARRIVTEALRLGLEALTLYSFSVENWRRPAEEVDLLMNLYAEYLLSERRTVLDNNIRLRHLGRRDGLPEKVLRELDASVAASAENTGMHLCLALNYGSRAEIVDALRRIAAKVAKGELAAQQINEQTVSQALDSSGVPDPDLLIRTSGEHRLSNFLLWQIHYAEFYVTETYWPDFTEDEFRKAIVFYAGRCRRFGGLDAATA
jgi:undecaprenyl diphosphate synthase